MTKSYDLTADKRLLLWSTERGIKLSINQVAQPQPSVMVSCDTKIAELDVLDEFREAPLPNANCARQPDQ